MSQWLLLKNHQQAAHWLNLNISKYELATRVVVEDVATALEGVKADLVVANPPYIPNQQAATA
jgi:release factor glutamine methyltransferase